MAIRILQSLLSAMKNGVRRIAQIVELGGYNRATIAEYFRKQGAQIGDGCNIRVRSLGAEPYLVKIGNHVTIAGGVKFITHDGAAWVFRQEIENIQVFGPIIIEDNCVIGENAILFPNIRIGPNSIVSAGSVVIADVPPNRIAMGIPARVWSSLDKYREKCVVRWKEQEPPDIIIEPGRNWWNSRNYKSNNDKLKRHLIKLFWEDKTSEDGKFSR
jgi:acetyltransferase-like isoleucine patch superfamily enzyme